MEELSYSEILKLNGNSYGNISEYYHETYKNEVNEKPYDKEFLDTFGAKLQVGATILDVGCGSSCQQGRYLHHQHKFQVHGIDISKKAISLAIKKYSNLSFSRMDMARTEFVDMSFDGILAFYSLIHIPPEKYSTIFLEWKRLLKPSGFLALVGHLGEHDGINEYKEQKFYFHAFNEQKIDDKLHEYGFEIISKKVREPIYTGEFEANRIYYLARQCK